MKKIFITTLSMVGILALSGCNGGNDTSTTSSQSPTNSTSVIGSSPVTSSNSPTTSSPMQPREITLTYAAWNLGNAEGDVKPNLEREMIRQFEDNHPNIKVDIIERPITPGTTNLQDWNEFLSTRAAIKKLPDVFYTDSIPRYIINDWVYDLTTLANADSEYNKLAEDVRAAAIYNNKVFALPNSIHYQGFLVNKTLFEEANITAPTLSNNFDVFIKKIKDSAKQVEGETRPIAGINRFQNFIDYYPSLLNDNYGWSTFDGEKFNFNSSEFTDTIDKFQEIYNDKTISYEALSADEKTLIFNDQWVFGQGMVLAEWGESYNFADYQKKMLDGTWDWELDFIGVPAVGGKRITPIVMDFTVVSKTTKYPQEAYELAKWMGFGKDGYKKRLEIPKNDFRYDAVNFAPLQDDAELLDEFFSLYPSFTNYRTIVESNSFIVEPNKYLPGYNDARYDAYYDADMKMKDVFFAICSGALKLSDIGEALNKKANDIYNAENDLVQEKIK